MQAVVTAFRPRIRAAVFAALAVMGLGAPALAAAPPKPAVVSFAYTPAEVARGRDAYGPNCAACHGAKLEGTGAPALAGPNFLAHWTRDGRTLADLDDAIHRMPKAAPNSLTAAQYSDIRAYILAANDYQEGSTTVKSVAATPELDLPSAPASVTKAKADWPTQDELTNPSDADWLMYNRDYKGQRYSKLNQIDASNAAQLQPVCMMQMGVPGSFQSSPVIYKGTGYITSTYATVAFDAATCEKKWTHTYTIKGPETFPTNRGAALYEGKVFRGTTDGHLLALDATTGDLLWDVHVADSGHGYLVGVAPIVYQGRVFVGLSGGEYGTQGKIYAFNADDGKLLWTFRAIPTGKEPGAETWLKGAEVGGGPTWTSFSVDVKDGLVYAPIGNPGPDFLASVRPGSNLYTNSVVALDAATGKLRWWVQQIAGDYHDWDTAAPPVLYEQDGRRFMVEGSKDGFVYIYDRDTHKLKAKVPVTTIKNQDVPLSFDKKVMVCPGGVGGVEWYGPAYDPALKSLFVGTVDWCADFSLTTPEGFTRGSLYVEGQVDFTPISEQKGWLKAIEAGTGKELWSYRAPKPMVGGVTPTAGGVVLTGGTDGDFMVFNSRDGKILYRFHTGGAVGGGVSTYLAGGRQYVAVASGNRSVMPFGIQGSPTIVVFALPEAGQ